MFFTVIFILASLKEVAAASIDERDGGYNVVVALHNSVPPANLIIQNIKVLFRQGSQQLHQATYGKFYFKRVTIVLPSSWPQTSERQVTGDSLFPRADVRVGGAPSSGSESRPFTHHQRGCGERGEYIQVPTEFLVSMNLSSLAECGSPVFILTHEWARFRYGVFDDSGPPSHDGCHLFCTEGLQLFRFCNEEGNVNISPTKNSQYETCASKPTWAVIRESDDYHELQGPSLETIPDVVFHVIQRIQGRGRRTVLVFDTSSSIEPRFFSLVKRSTLYIIRSLFPDENRLSIVSFNEGSHIEHPLDVIGPSTRETFANAIRSLRPGGDACVACGVERSLTVLMSQGESPDGASVCIFLGSQSNQSGNTANFFPAILEKNVVLHTFALVFDDFYRLSVKTGGKAFFFGDVKNGQQIALEEALTEVVYSNLPEWQQPVLLLKASKTFVKTLTCMFNVPFELGKETSVRIVGRPGQKLDARLIHERGTICADCTVIKDDEATSFLLIIPSPAQSGQWQLTLTARHQGPADVGILVKSFQKDKNVATVRAAIYFGRSIVTAGNVPVVYVKVTKGNDVVRHADVVVMVTPPDASSRTRITLRDDGLGFDVQRNDGVYTTSLVGDIERGFYHVQAEIRVVGDVEPEMNLRRRDPFFKFVRNADTKSVLPVFVNHQIQRRTPQYTTAHIKTIPTYDWDNPVPRVNLPIIILPSGGFIVLEDIPVTVHSPTRIKDLSVSGRSIIRPHKPLVSLDWTSMGAYGGHYRASFIEIRISDNEEKIIKNFTQTTLITWNEVVTGSLIPVDPWKVQNMTIAIPPEYLGDDAHLFIGMRYWNNYSRVSRLSNIAKVRMKNSLKSPTSTSTSITPETSRASWTETSGTASSAPDISQTVRSSAIPPQQYCAGASILLSSALLVLFFTVICATHVIVSRRNNGAEHREEATPSGTEPPSSWRPGTNDDDVDDVILGVVNTDNMAELQRYDRELRGLTEHLEGRHTTVP